MQTEGWFIRREKEKESVSRRGVRRKKSQDGKRVDAGGKARLPPPYRHRQSLARVACVVGSEMMRREESVLVNHDHRLMRLPSVARIA